MSTTFDIFPCNSFLPTFKDVIELANFKLKEFLYNLGISEEINLVVELRSKDKSIILDSVLKEQFKWNDTFYAWFYIDGIPGGTDAYCWCFDKEDRLIWDEEIQTNPRVQRHAEELKKSLEIGYHWNFRRSAGQPGIICLAYGLIAASLCKLTEGLIYSDDGAWDYKMFPTTADDFFDWYFRPELSSIQEEKDWAKSCIDSIYKAFKALKARSETLS